MQGEKRKRVGLKSKGYKIGLEVLVKGKYLSVCEVPYLFRNRFVGKSKIGASEYYYYIGSLLRLYPYGLFHRRKIKIRYFVAKS